LVWEDLTKQHTREQETKVTKRTRKSQGACHLKGQDQKGQEITQA